MTFTGKERRWLRGWKTWLAVLAAAIAVGGYARAGTKKDSSVSVVTGGAFGSMGTARAGKNADTSEDQELVRVEVFAWDTPAPGGSTEVVATFKNAAGTQAMCHTYNPAVGSALQQAVSDSKVSVQFVPPAGNVTPDCNTVIITNSSEFAPKAP